MGSPSEVAHTRVQQQEVVAELGQQALETDDLDQLMHDASVAVAETLDNEYAKVLELLPNGDEVFLRQGVGWRDGLVGSATVPTDLDSQAGYTLISEEPVIVDDLRTEERFSGPELLTSHDVVSGISVIIGSVEEPWGVLGTHTIERREFTEHDANFVQSVANVLAAAIDRAEKEQRLREREAQLDVATEAASIGLWTWDIQENVVTADEYLAESYGVAPEEAAAGAPMEAFYEPIHEDDTEQTWNQLEQAVEETGELKAEYRVRDATGDYIWVLARGEVEYDDDGEPTRLNGAITDITERKERERELERAFDLLDRTERIADVGGWEIDVDTQDVFWTDHIFDLLKVDADEEPPLDEALDMYHEDDQPIVEAAVENALASGEPFDVDVRVQTASGEMRWIRLQGIPEVDGNEVISFRGAAQDITEHKERERDLEWYETIVETVNDGVYVVDEDGTFQMVNETYAEMLGYSPDELIGTAAATVVEGDGVLEQVEELHAATSEGDVEQPSMEGVIRTARGERLPAEATFAPLPGDESDWHRVGVVRDISERKERERALEESERRYRTLVEHFPNGAVGLFDEDLEYTAVGGELLDTTGVEPKDRIGDRVYDIYPDELVEEVESYFHAALEGEANSFEAEYHNRHLHAHTLPIRNADDEVFAGMLVVQDVTERREYERMLEESNERLEQFAYAASHDLQEPLRMVSSYLQLIENRYGETLDEDGREFLAFAVDGAERMQSMIEGLLQYSRVETQGNEFETVDLESIFEDAQENLQMKIEEHGAEITMDSLPCVEGDEGQLHQVFQNLLSNAIEYSGEEPPQVHVSAKQNEKEVTVSVTDEGVGIDPDDQDRIFEVFQRVHSNSNKSGSGIGLALCERIVERHGGEIWVDSESGEGATFSFTLPAAR